MRKLFTLFAAVLVALTVNAEIWTIEENSENILSTMIGLAYFQDGDTIALKTEDYIETGSISISKNITIQAAEGSTPHLQLGGKIAISGSVNVKFDGIKIKADGSHDAFDISAGGILELKGCEVYNLADRRAIKVGETAHLDAIKINNCYFHGGTNYCAIEVESNSTQNGCDLVEIKNSTFANFTLGDKAVIAINSKGSKMAADPADDVDLTVDHCTFYNCTKNNNSTYGCIDLRKSSKATVSNCIFANPSDIPEGRFASRATQLYAGTVSNCLVDANTPNHRDDDITINNPLKDVDPLFFDAANGDFCLRAGSPAIGAATDESNLGDPRWGVAKTLYFNEGVWGEADAARYELYCITNESWLTLEEVEDEDGIFSAEISSAVTDVVFCRMDPTLPEGQWSSLQNQTVDQNIPEGKDLFKVTSWGEGYGAKCTGTWSVYGEKSLENGFYLIGSFGGVDAWNVEDLTAAKQFTWNKHIGDENEEWTITIDLAEGDKFKAVYVYEGAITSYIPDGTDNDYVVDANHAGEAKTIYFQQKYNNDWGGHFYIEPNSATAIDQTTSDQHQTTKSIVNGQLLIIRDGKTYNVLGAEIR